MKKIVYIAWCFALLLLETGCSVYKEYKRPKELPLSSSFSDAVSTDSTENMASISWRDFFCDRNLQNLIEIGLQNNTDLQIARARISGVQANLSAARLAFFPALQVSPSGTLSSLDYGKTYKSYDLGGNFSWELPTSGKHINELRQAKSSLLKADAYKQSVCSKLISTIAENYYMLVMLDCQLNIDSLTAYNWNEYIKVLKVLKLSGQTTESAINQAEANRLTVEAAMWSLKKQIATLENDFSALCGVTTFAIKRSNELNYEWDSPLFIGVPLQLLHNRPDVRQKELDLEYAFYQTNITKSAFYPNLTLSGSAGWTNSVGGTIVNPGATLMSAVASLTQPIFNKGKNRANLKIAQAQQEEALLAYQQIILDAGNDVNKALIACKVSKERVDIFIRQQEKLERAVDNSKMTMRYDRGNYLEVLTAEQSLLQSRLNEIAERYEEIINRIALYHTLGGGTK